MKALIVIFLLFSFSATAADCVKVKNNGVLAISNQPVDACPSGLIILTKSDYDAISLEAIVAVLKDLFEFSIEDFAYFNAICLIGFITGHSLGRVNRILGKT